jgi:hypothetical protein
MPSARRLQANRRNGAPSTAPNAPKARPSRSPTATPTVVGHETLSDHPATITRQPPPAGKKSDKTKLIPFLGQIPKTTGNRET